MTPLVAHQSALESTLPDDGPAWLAPSEWPDYRQQPPNAARLWLLGRILAKQLVQKLLKPDAEPCELAIHSRNGMGRGMRPQVFLRGRALDCSLSISHANDVVLVGLGTRPRLLVGVDVTAPFQPTAGFLDLFVTARERTWLDSGGCTVAGLWAVKEAAYKAANRGEPFQARDIEVRPLPSGRLGFARAGDGPPSQGLADLIELGPAIGALAAYERSLA